MDLKNTAMAGNQTSGGASKGNEGGFKLNHLKFSHKKMEFMCGIYN